MRCVGVCIVKITGHCEEADETTGDAALDPRSTAEATAIVVSSVPLALLLRRNPTYLLCLLSVEVAYMQ
ncbi:hypothetical protein C8Q74DRAFT_1267814 [Fomes fomentarius]|nr:hypothetical protein C8Q74DRAFT_1267814 [Fomes fomentarius]